MSKATDLYGDVNITGTLTAASFTPPAGSIGNSALTGGANNYISSAKLQQRLRKQFSQEGATTSAAERRVVHVVRGATGTILELVVGAVVANIGAATVVIDCLKNGSSILTAQITLTNSTAAYVLVAGTLSVTSVAAGDVLEVQVVSATAGGGTIAKGVFAELSLTEDPA